MKKTGRLMAIGGAEARREDMVVLGRFVEFCGVPSPKIVVLTAATGIPEKVSQTYADAFRLLGVEHLSVIDMRERWQADATDAAAEVAAADGIFMTGGDQNRLVSVIGRTATAKAMFEAFHDRGACIGGTSAGAAALSLDMLAEGDAPPLPEKDAVRIAHGFGLLPNTIIDQHFSQRGRLGRLLSAVAKHPRKIGVGIDEDTALLIEPGIGIEVIGAGAVSLVDGREMRSNLAESDLDAPLELLDVRLHLLPAGHRYRIVPPHDPAHALPDSLVDAIGTLIETAPPLA